MQPLSKQARIEPPATASSLPLHPRSLFSQLPPIPPAAVTHYTPAGLGSLDDDDSENAPTPPATDDTGMGPEEAKEDDANSLLPAAFVSAGAAPSPSTSLSFLRTSTSPIRLNVGGLLFQTTFQTLCFEPHTYFAARFGGRFEEQASPYDGSFFIDRDGTHFRHILNWMRDNVLSVGHTDIDTLIQLKLEAEFYLMPNLVKEVDRKISEARVERMAQKMDAASAAAATPPMAKNPHMPSAGASSASRSSQHPVPPASHRNLFVTNWGAPGGMGSTGPAGFVSGGSASAVRSFSSAASSSAASAAAAASQHYPSHAATAAQPHLPTRTHSCPSAMYAPDGSHTSTTVPASSQRPSPMHHHSSSSGNSDALLPHSMQSQLQSHPYAHPADVDHDDRSMEAEVEEPFTTDADF